MTPSRKRRGAVVAVLLLAAAVVICAVLARRQPAWWSPTPPAGEAALETSRALEQGVASQTTQVRGTGVQPWSVSVRADDINAWLNARLPQWLEHDRSLPWPKDVGMPQVHITQGGIDAAALWNGWLVRSSWTLEPGRDSGAARLVPGSAHVGTLPVPFADGIGAWFVPELASPVLLETTLSDGRTVRVTDVRLSDGQAIIDCVTVSR
jgi:hypothetical protein